MHYILYIPPLAFYLSMMQIYSIHGKLLGVLQKQHLRLRWSHSSVTRDGKKERETEEQKEKEKASLRLQIAEQYL